MKVERCEFRGDPPFDSFMPWKVEIHSQDPRIEVYHDLISSDLADKLSVLSHENLVGKHFPTTQLISFNSSVLH